MNLELRPLQKLTIALLLFETYFVNFQKYVLFELQNSAKITISKMEFNVRQANLDDLKKIVEMRINKGFLREYKRRKYAVEIMNRMNSGCCCFVAESDDRILGAVWAVFNKVYFPEFRKEFILHNNEIMFFDAYAHPDYRGKGAASKIYECAIKCLKAKKFFVFVGRYNKPSLRVVEKLDFRTIGTITFLKFLGINRVQITPEKNMETRCTIEIN